MKIILIGISFLFIPINLFAASAHKCGGNEPYWNLDMTPKEIVFHDLGQGGKVRLKAVQPTPANGYQQSFMEVFRTVQTHNQKPVTIVIQKTKCSDGMSDTPYPYQVIYLSENGTWVGCCDK